MSVDTKKVASASKALKKYLNSQESESDKSQLFEDDADFLYLVVKSRKYFTDERILKPKLVELPTKLWQYRSESPKICAFVRDPQREYKDALLDGQTPLSRCVGVSKLKGKFKPYEARRALRSDFDIFVAEDDVVAMLPKLLGKSFYGKQQYVPFPVKMKTKGGRIDASKVNAATTQILNSTALIYPASHTMYVRVATTKHTDKEIASNVKAVMDTIGFKNILSLSICTPQSPSLPVYYVDQIYSESDIGDENEDDGFETDGQKRRREEAHLDELLAEVVDEDEIKEYNREQKRRRKQRVQGNTISGEQTGDKTATEETQEESKEVEESKPVEEPEEPKESKESKAAAEEPKKSDAKTSKSSKAPKSRTAESAKTAKALKSKKIKA